MSHELRRLTRSEAEYLMMSASVAGGWIAVHPTCREAVASLLTRAESADFLALLPGEWTQGRGRRVPPIADIRAALELQAAYPCCGDGDEPLEYLELLASFDAASAEVAS